ncbi:Mor transcription activator family protein [Pasteurella multocida]|uniref:Mor transcription activator family protein n=1 Tax=Pasteurella multocida TaxID=747 RepID=UPI00397DADEC
MEEKVEKLNNFIEAINMAVEVAVDEHSDKDEIKAKIIQLIFEKMGGIVLYIPRGIKSSNTARNKLIIAKYDGKNVKELARAFGLSEQWIYSILAKEKNQKRKND